jgi:hypothetical protein
VEHSIILIVAQMKELGHLLVPLILIISTLGLYLSGDLFDDLIEKLEL